MNKLMTPGQRQWAAYREWAADRLPEHTPWAATQTESYSLRAEQGLEPAWWQTTKGAKHATKLWLKSGEQPKLPHDALLQSAPTRTPHLATSEQDANGDRPAATLLDVAMGLRAMLTNQLPAAKPTLEVLGTVTQLPRQTKELAVLQETGNWQRKLAARDKVGNASRAGQLAEAELSVWADHSQTWKLQQELEGNPARAWDDLGSCDEPTDDSRASEMAAAELREWLVLHLTAKEVEALEQRANSEPQRDRTGETLARAQRKAQASLRG